MSEKDSRDSFYFLNAYQDGITPGQKITIQHNVSYNDWRAAPHLAPLVKLTDAEINQRKEASITLEKELYAKLKQIASEWDEQAAHTMLLERALEYVHTPEVEHTANEWKERENGVWEISNRTYKMRYQITYAKGTDIYLVSWGIIYNAPKQPNSKYANYWGDSIYVARQDKKKYPSMEAAQNYIQGRFDLYSHLFRELSPPIPNECKRMFSINGCLAPGYTLAPPDKEEPDKQAVAADNKKNYEQNLVLQYASYCYKSSLLTLALVVFLPTMKEAHLIILFSILYNYMVENKVHITSYQNVLVEILQSY